MLASFQEELKADVVDECRDRGYGEVLHIAIEVPDLSSRPYSPAELDQEEYMSKVWLKFTSEEECRKTVEGLDGRWFAKRKVRAGFVRPDVYGATFGA